MLDGSVGGVDREFDVRCVRFHLRKCHWVNKFQGLKYEVKVHGTAINLAYTGGIG